MRLSVPGHKDLKKIVVLNPKGGCGKSTLAVNLSGYLASRGNSVAIMDFDPQGSSIRWLKLRPKILHPFMEFLPSMLKVVQHVAGNSGFRITFATWW